MRFNDKDNVDGIQAGADYTKTYEVSVQPGFNWEGNGQLCWTTLKLLGAVESSTNDAVSAEEMAPQEESKGKMKIGMACVSGLLFFHTCDVNGPSLIRDSTL